MFLTSLSCLIEVRILALILVTNLTVAKGFYHFHLCPLEVILSEYVVPISFSQMWDRLKCRKRKKKTQKYQEKETEKNKKTDGESKKESGRARRERQWERTKAKERGLIDSNIKGERERESDTMSQRIQK